MPVSLVFHPVGSVDGDESPFATVLLRVAAGSATLRLACPYLTVEYLAELVRGVPSWRLVTDLEEWLSSDVSDAACVAAFVASNVEHIRDFRMLHAKVAVGDTLALAGSANFTRAGLKRRTEMGVLLDDADALAGLQCWFDAVWTAAAVPDLMRVAAFVDRVTDPTLRAAADEIARARRAASLGPAGAQVRARASFGRGVALASVSGGDNGDEYRHTVDRVRDLAADAATAAAHLDLLREAISTAGLAEADPRLVVSVPHHPKIAVSVNSRYVAHWTRRRGSILCGFIVDREFSEDPRILVEADDIEPFKPQPGPFWIRLPWKPGYQLPDGFGESWRRCIQAELNHGTKSPWRDRFHSRTAFLAIMDPATRARVLADAFQRV